MPGNTSTHHLISNRICRLSNLQKNINQATATIGYGFRPLQRKPFRNGASLAIISWPPTSLCIFAGKAVFRGGWGNKLTPHLRSKNPSFGNLQLDQLEFRNFGFPGRSLFRPEHKPFLAQNLCFRTRNLSFSQGSETFVSQPETNLFPRVSLFPPPPPPQASQSPGFETNIFHHFPLEK